MKFEHTFYNIAVSYISHYTTGTPLFIIDILSMLKFS